MSGLNPNLLQYFGFRYAFSPVLHAPVDSKNVATDRDIWCKNPRGQGVNLFKAINADGIRSSVYSNRLRFEYSRFIWTINLQIFPRICRRPSSIPVICFSVLFFQSLFVSKESLLPAFLRVAARRNENRWDYIEKGKRLLNICIPVHVWICLKHSLKF